jgi:hypothetical protein
MIQQEKLASAFGMFERSIAQPSYCPSPLIFGRNARETPACGPPTRACGPPTRVSLHPCGSKLGSNLRPQN